MFEVQFYDLNTSSLETLIFSWYRTLTLSKFTSVKILILLKSYKQYLKIKTNLILKKIIIQMSWLESNHMSQKIVK